MAQRTIEVLHDGGDWVVVNKPAGLPVQPGEAVGANLAGELEAIWGQPPHLVHRLDRDTAGCLIVGKTRQAAARMAKILSDPGSRKTYHAVVKGIPEDASGEISETIEVHGVKKRALTRWKLVRQLGGECSLLEIVLDTGRMHQIRIHMAKKGHPLVGDDRHGDFAFNRRMKREAGAKKLLLVAVRLELSGGIRVEAPWPAHFSGFCARFPADP